MHLSRILNGIRKLQFLHLKVRGLEISSVYPCEAGGAVDGDGHIVHKAIKVAA